MAFSTLQFLLFFIFVIIIYYVLPFRHRWLFLTAAGFVFYSYLQLYHLAILITSSLIDYFLALRLGGNAARKKRKILLLLGLFNNLGLLVLFKYLHFFNESMGAILNRFHVHYSIAIPRLLLPLGLSYFTFKKISYLVDVYRGGQRAERHVGRFLLYVSFFPEIVAGPIDRAGKLIPQFLKKVEFDAGAVSEGLRLVLWGFFKKLVIADNLAPVVSQVFSNPTRFDGIHLLVGVLSFTFQVYCDFSGYSDIAIGIGRVLGFKLMKNFDRPYHSTSIPQFWERWHISFTTWLRDYLFLPIAYSVSGKIKQPKPMGIKAETWAYLCGMFTTMLLCGLWHGAGWTFIIWGLMHGIYLAASFFTKKWRGRMRKRLLIKKNAPLYKAFRVLLTFSLVSLAWVFFRAQSTADAVYIITHLFSGIPTFFQQVFMFIQNLNGKSLSHFLINRELGTTYFNLLMVCLSILFMRRVQTMQKDKEEPTEVLANSPILLRWAAYLGIVFWILFFGNFGVREFIYAQF